MLENEVNKIVYLVGEARVFSFSVRFFSAQDISCYLEQDDGESTLLILNVDYSIEAKNDYTEGANITLLIDPLPTGKKLAIARELSLTQELSLPDYGKLPASSLETQLDKIVMMIQQQAENLQRAILGDVVAGSYDVSVLMDYLVEAIQEAKDAATEAQLAAAMAAINAKRAEFEVFYSLSPEAPEGAYLLNGQWLDCSDDIFDTFYDKLTELNVRKLDEDSYAEELSTYGQCGAFVVKSRTAVRLPTVNRFIKASLDDVGESGLDQIVNITGEALVLARSWYDDTDYEGAFTTRQEYVKQQCLEETDSSHDSYNHYLELDASNVVRTGDEVTPRYINMYCYMQVHTPEIVVPESEDTSTNSVTLLNKVFSADDLTNTTLNGDDEITGGVITYSFSDLGVSGVAMTQLLYGGVVLDGSACVEISWSSSGVTITLSDFSAIDSSFTLLYFGVPADGNTNGDSDDYLAGTPDDPDNVFYFSDYNDAYAYMNKIIGIIYPSASDYDWSGITFPLYSTTNDIVVALGNCDSSTGQGSGDLAVCGFHGPMCPTYGHSSPGRVWLFRNTSTGELFLTNGCPEGATLYLVANSDYVLV